MLIQTDLILYYNWFVWGTTWMIMLHTTLAWSTIRIPLYCISTSLPPPSLAVPSTAKLDKGSMSFEAWLVGL